MDKKVLRSGKTYDSSLITIQKSYGLLNRIHNKMRNENKLSIELHNVTIENENLKEQMNYMYRKYMFISTLYWVSLLISISTNIYMAFHHEELYDNFNKCYNEVNKSVANVMNQMKYKMI